MGSELDTLGAEGDVGELLVAPEAGERGVVRHAAVKRELGCSGGLRGGRGGGAGALPRHSAVCLALLHSLPVCVLTTGRNAVSKKVPGPFSL